MKSCLESLSEDFDGPNSLIIIDTLIKSSYFRSDEEASFTIHGQSYNYLALSKRMILNDPLNSMGYKQLSNNFPSVEKVFLENRIGEVSEEWVIDQYMRLAPYNPCLWYQKSRREADPYLKDHYENLCFELAGGSNCIHGFYNYILSNCVEEEMKMTRMVEAVNIHATLIAYVSDSPQGSTYRMVYFPHYNGCYGSLSPWKFREFFLGSLIDLLYELAALLPNEDKVVRISGINYN